MSYVPGPRIAVCTECLKSGTPEMSEFGSALIFAGPEIDLAAKLMAAFDQFQNDGATCFFYLQLNVQRQIAHPVRINFVRTLRASGRVAIVVGIFIFDDRQLPRRRDDVLIANPRHLRRRVFGGERFVVCTRGPGACFAGATHGCQRGLVPDSIIFGTT